MDAVGKRFELNPHTDKLLPSTQVVKLGKNIPQINGAFVAPSATIAGRVTVGKGSSIWYGAVLRGDESYITIGDGCTISDRVMVHCSMHPKELPTLVGNGVVVNAGAILHGCVLDDSCLVGEGAQVMDGAKVGKGAIVAPGSLVGQGKSVPAGQLWSGVPARYVRNVSDEEAASIVAVSLENATLAAEHAMECVKTWQTIEQEEYDFEQKTARNEQYYRKLSPEEITKKLGEIEYHEAPGRIFNSEVSTRNHPESRP